MVLTGTPHATDPLVYEGRQLFRSCLAVELERAGMETSKSGSDLVPPTELDEALRPVGERLSEMNDEVQVTYKESFAEIKERIPADQAFSQATLTQVGARLFRSGITWGRLIAFLAFANQMALLGRRKGVPDAEDDVTLWTCQVISTELVPWLRRQEGGWRGLLHQFGPPRQHQPLATIGRHIKFVLTVGVVAAIGGLSIGIISTAVGH